MYDDKDVCEHTDNSSEVNDHELYLFDKFVYKNMQDYTIEMRVHPPKPPIKR